jgi:hypothetical protein
MSQRDPEKPPRFCPNCGAQTMAGVSHCTVCGQPLYKREVIERLWGRDTTTPSSGVVDIIDLYPEQDLSLQATTPFTQTRPFDPSERLSSADAAPSNEKTRDPRSSAGGKLSKGISSEAIPAPVSEQAHGGPPGLVLGCLAFLIIAVVGALLAWGAVRPIVSNQVEDEISVGISNELRKVGQISVPASGQVTLTEDQIHADLVRYSDLYDPINDVAVTIQPKEVAIRFKLYGLTSTFRGGLTVEDGRIVVVDPSLDGPAGRIVNADDISSAFETEVAELLSRSNLKPTAVKLRNGSIVISTAPVS